MIEGLPSPEELPSRLKELRSKAAHLLECLAPMLVELKDGEAEHQQRKTMADEGIEEHEFLNAYMPILNFQSAHKPVVCAFEVRDGGPMDGKRIVTLCVLLADGKTVMPVLQVPDFDMIAGAQYVGTKEREVILPEDSVGIAWQETINKTYNEYMNPEGD